MRLALGTTVAASWDRLDIRFDASRDRGAFRIRRARPRDLARIAEVEQASFSAPWSSTAFRSLVNSKQNVLFIVAEGCEPRSDVEDQRVFGHAVVWCVAGEAELANLAVAPAVRGRGVGGALLDVLLAVLRDSGIAVVFLEVRASNRVALELYASRGFREVGTRMRYYQRPTEDARILRLDVDASLGIQVDREKVIE